MNAKDSRSDDLAVARAAARRYAAEFELPTEQQDQLLQEPLFGPVGLERDSTSVVAFRWLGGGRGGPYLQAEIDHSHRTARVYYGAAHTDLPSRSYTIADLGDV